MRYKYKITEGDQTTEKEAMSLKKMMKELDPKKTFIVEYTNKKVIVRKDYYKWKT